MYASVSKVDLEYAGDDDFGDITTGTLYLDINYLVLFARFATGWVHFSTAFSILSHEHEHTVLYEAEFDLEAVLRENMMFVPVGTFKVGTNQSFEKRHRTEGLLLQRLPEAPGLCVSLGLVTISPRSTGDEYHGVACKSGQECSNCCFH